MSEHLLSFCSLPVHTCVHTNMCAFTCRCAHNCKHTHTHTHSIQWSVQCLDVKRWILRAELTDAMEEEWQREWGSLFQSNGAQWKVCWPEDLRWADGRRSSLASAKKMSNWPDRAYSGMRLEKQERAWLLSDLKVIRFLYWTHDWTWSQCRAWSWWIRDM